MTNISRRAALAGTGIALVGGSAFSAPATQHSKIDTLISMSKSAVAEFERTVPIYEAAKEEEELDRQNHAIMTPLTMAHNNGKSPCYLQITDVDRESYIKQINQEHYLRGVHRNSPLGRMLGDDARNLVKRRLNQSRRKCIRKLDAALKQYRTRPAMMALEKAQRQYDAAAEAEKNALIVLLKAYPTTSAEARAKAEHVKTHPLIDGCMPCEDIIDAMLDGMSAEAA